MTKEKRLKKEAMESAQWRGHKFSGKWDKHDRLPIFMRECIVCAAFVAVDLSPAPNGIDIGGSAVAINCHGR